MYLALAVMFIGVVVGRVGKSIMSRFPFSSSLYAAILCLLLILGIQIGSDDRLFQALPIFGYVSLILTFSFLTGSIICAIFVEKIFLRKHER